MMTVIMDDQILFANKLLQMIIKGVCTDSDKACTNVFIFKTSFQYPTINVCAVSLAVRFDFLGLRYVRQNNLIICNADWINQTVSKIPENSCFA